MKYWKAMVWLLIILGFLTFLPMNVSRPNFLGLFTLCSYAPVATIAMFILALAVYSFVTRRRWLFCANVFVLLIILGFTGFWIYGAKLPIDSVAAEIAIYNYYFGKDRADGGNVSAIFLNLTLNNPLMRDTPAFRVEYYDFYINGKKILLLTYDLLGAGGGMDMFRDRRWIGSFITLGPQQTTILQIEVLLYHEYTKVEGGTIEDIWTPLSNRNFTFSMDGILVSRIYSSQESISWDLDMGVWASKPFSISCEFQ